MNELVLIDLSSIAHPIWHMSQAEPDPNATCTGIVARVRALASAHPYAAICCDSGRSFRKDLNATYKANRPESDATLQHQITLAREVLAADGFPIWAAAGFEADDLIASAVTKALALDDLTVLVVSADKDLLQLVGPRVRQMRPDTGAILDPEAVFVRLGVHPSQVCDYLTLTGDASDNIKGATGIGPKKAADLLATYGSLDNVFAAWHEKPSSFKPAMASTLREFEPVHKATRELVALRSDAPIPFEEIATERTPKDAEAFTDETFAEPEPVAAVIPPVVAEPVTEAPAAPASMVVRDPDILPAVSEYQLQLDPRSLSQAKEVAAWMHQSRLFSAYGTPQGVLATIMLGRELGLPAMASLRQIHVIEGKQALSASLMVALVLKSGLAEYFEPVEFTETSATFETKRKGARNPVKLTHTLAMAQTAGLVKPNSNWVKVPTDMLVARAQSRLARLVYPDIIGGLYTPDELGHEARETERVA